MHGISYKRTLIMLNTLLPRLIELLVEQPLITICAYPGDMV
jgi:hypothetical protein